MNILLICKRHYTGHDLLSDKFGRLYHFPRQWADSGHKVTVVTADYRSMKRERVSEPNLDLIAANFLVPLRGFAKEIARAIAQSRPDLVVASCDSHFGYIALRLARRLGVPFVFDLYHNYEDFGSNQLPGMRRMYQRALKGADLVVCDSEALSAKVKSRSKRIHIAPQATDSMIFKPLDMATCRRELGLGADSCILVYVGNVDSRFDRDTVLSALDRLADSGLESTLLIAGPGVDRQTQAHPRVQYLGRMPQSNIPKVIACADVCLIPYKLTALVETCNPCKLSEYIACGRSIVASDVSNVRQYLPRSGHLCYPPGNANALMDSISRQLASPILEDRHAALLWSKVGGEYLEKLEELNQNRHSL